MAADGLRSSKFWGIKMKASFLRLISRGIFLGLFAPILLVACTNAAIQATNSENGAELKSMRVNEATLHYIERGHGTPVVLVHGALGDYRTWDGQLEEFSIGHTVIAVSMRGHYPNPSSDAAAGGATGLNEVAVQAEDLAEFIRSLDLGPVHLVGHSGGALRSLLVARNHPNLLRSLTLGEPPAFSLFPPGSEGDLLAQRFVADVTIPAAEAFQNGDDKLGVERFIGGVVGKDIFAAYPEYRHTALLDNAWTLNFGLADKAPPPNFTCADASGIRVPTLLIEGALSPKMFILALDILEECLPTSSRASIADASHGLEMENPEAFNETVLTFLDQYE